MNRRDFLKTASAGLATVALSVRPATAVAESLPKAMLPEVDIQHLPRWRGFNLQEKFSHTPDEWKTVAPEWGHNNEPFQESDFEWMANWGFNFVRLPMSYKCWTHPADPMKFMEQPLKEIDQAVKYGKRYGLHVNLNFHRAPGYCINRCSGEPLTLWTDPPTQDLFVHHWTCFAQRYKGIPAAQLSFDLVNEPTCTETQYVPLVKRTVAAIHAVDPQRPVIADGLNCGNQPVQGLVGVAVAQSARGYAPGSLTHYLATWAGSPQRKPTWPLRRNDGSVECDKETLRKQMAHPWQALAAKGVGVHVGEWGCYNKTPHEVTLAWMRDYLALWKEAGWGWSLWCFRGSFGIVDSGRADITYQKFKGHKLDRKMLELLQEF